MRKSILGFILLLLANGQALAEDCPDFFRFVDFGLETQDRTVRGGPTYRAESFEGRALLIRDLTVCRELRNLASDGHGIPIPIVTSITYDPNKTGVDLKALRLTASDNIALDAEASAAEHRARLARSDTVTTRGPDHLCVRLPERNEVSCQVISPFGSNLALIVYCDLAGCRMPVLALNEKVIASAMWTISHASLRDPDDVASEIKEKIAQLHDFLAPLSSWRADFTRFDR